MSDLLQRILAFTENLSQPKPSKPEQEIFRTIDGIELIFRPRLERGALVLEDDHATCGIRTLDDGRQIQIAEGSLVYKISYDRLSQDQLKQIHDENNKKAESEAKLINLKKYLANSLQYLKQKNDE